MKLTKLIITIFISVLLLNFQSTRKETKKLPLKLNTPNIVIIYADDLGFGHVSSYGSTELLIPNVDCIAKRC